MEFAPDNLALLSRIQFALVGTMLLLPMVLGYTVFVLWVFRGKLKPGEG